MGMPSSQRHQIHGLYSKVITASEKAELSKIPVTSIEAEIAYLRTICSRLAKVVNENGLKHGAVKPVDDATIRTLNALDLKLNTLLRYVRTQAYLKGEPNEYDRLAWSLYSAALIIRGRDPREEMDGHY
jgi:hypothetical protein